MTAHHALDHGITWQQPTTKIKSKAESCHSYIFAKESVTRYAADLLPEAQLLHIK